MKTASYIHADGSVTFKFDYGHINRHSMWKVDTGEASFDFLTLKELYLWLGRNKLKVSSKGRVERDGVFLGCLTRVEIDPSWR